MPVSGSYAAGEHAQSAYLTLTRTVARVDQLLIFVDQHGSQRCCSSSATFADEKRCSVE